MTQWWNSAYNDIIIQLPQSIVDCLKHRIQNTKIRGKKCDLNEESENLRGLFDRELATYNNKKQCMKMNNKRYEERLPARREGKGVYSRNQKGASRMYKQDNVFRTSARRDVQDNRAEGQIYHEADDGDQSIQRKVGAPIDLLETDL